MILKYVNIKNFRSIKNVTLTFEPQCLILVGINESGKTNILKAIRLIDPDITTSPDDVRQAGHDEDLSENSYVMFVFDLTDEEFEVAYDQIVAKILTRADFDINNSKFVKTRNLKLNLKELLSSQRSTLYTANITQSKRWYQNWDLGSNYTLTEEWLKINDNVGEGELFIEVSGEKVDAKSFLAISSTLISKEQREKFQIVKSSDIIKYYNALKSKALRENHPSSIYWSFKEDNLLPEQIKLSSFIVSPNTCLPLKHMFLLSGIEDSKIGESIKNASKTVSGLRNLLNRVANSASKYLHEAWPDYSGITFELSPNGDNIDCLLKDKYNAYGLSSRSDGFKRFVTFLLSIAVRAYTSDLKGVIFIQDEPDTSLHPSAARQLLQELLKVADTNTVVFSTHSIFMIDRNKLDRHIIVQKTDEVTETKIANSSNIVDEEVIYNALGHSIFDILKQNNIIFEGWKDKKAFSDTISTKFAKASIMKKLQGVGVCHSFGVKDIERVAAFLELANRSWIIITDGDAPARERQRRYQGKGKWFRYDELLEKDFEMTFEDFIKFDYIMERIEYLKSNDYADKSFDDLILSTETPVLKSISSWLGRNEIRGEEQKTLIAKIKDLLASDLEVRYLSESYFTALSKISEILE